MTLQQIYSKHFPYIFKSLLDNWSALASEGSLKYQSFEQLLLDGPIKMEVLATLYLAETIKESVPIGMEFYKFG